MKKFVTTTIAFALLASVILPLSQASRMRYHQIIRQRAQQKTAQREALRKPVPVTDYKSLWMNRSFKKPVKPLEYRRVTSTLPRRANSDRIGAFHDTRRKTSSYGGPVRFQKAQEAVSSFVTYRDNDISMHVPIYWEKTSDVEVNTEYDAGREMYFGNQESPFVVRVKTFPKDSCSNAYGIVASCYKRLSYLENKQAMEYPSQLSVLSPVERKSRQREIYLNQPGWMQVYEESFFGSKYGHEQFFISRLLVANSDGDVYMVETTVPRDKAGAYVAVTKRIFDSFRVVADKVMDQAPVVEQTDL